jgi:hypothetical protein
MLLLAASSRRPLLRFDHSDSPAFTGTIAIIRGMRVPVRPGYLHRSRRRLEGYPRRAWRSARDWFAWALSNGPWA